MTLCLRITRVLHIILYVLHSEVHHMYNWITVYPDPHAQQLKAGALPIHRY